MYEQQRPLEKHFRKIRFQNGEHLINLPSKIVTKLDLFKDQEVCFIPHRDKLACELYFKPPKKEETEVKDNETEQQHTEP